MAGATVWDGTTEGGNGIEVADITGVKSGSLLPISP
jgi:hypothetical protein